LDISAIPWPSVLIFEEPLAFNNLRKVNREFLPGTESDLCAHLCQPTLALDSDPINLFSLYPSFVGEETIKLANEDYHCVIYQVVRDNNRRKTQMWFSPERNYLPVQMVHYSEGKKRFNAHLVKYREFDGAEAPGDLRLNSDWR
jgi:hypothetical protein